MLKYSTPFRGKWLPISVDANVHRFSQPLPRKWNSYIFYIFFWEFRPCSLEAFYDVTEAHTPIHHREHVWGGPGYHGSVLLQLDFGVTGFNKTVNAHPHGL